MFYDILSKEYLQPEEAVPFLYTKFSHLKSLETSKEPRIEHVENVWMVCFVFMIWTSQN